MSNERTGPAAEMPERPPGQSRRPKLAIVVSHPIQHFCPLYKALSAAGNVDVIVLFASRSGLDTYHDREFGVEVGWGGDITDGFPFAFLPGATERRDVSVSLDCPELGDVLDAQRPDVVLVYGFFHRISRRAIRWARRHRRGVLQLSDSELLFARGPLTRIRKRILVPLFLRSVDVLLTVGDRNEEYYRFYGADSSRFLRCPFPVDEPAFDAAWLKRGILREETRRSLGVGEDTVVALGVGKLSERKRFLDIVLAVKRMRSRDVADMMHVVLAGEGAQRPAIERAVRDEMKGKVQLLGFVPPPELVALYHAADLLIHPSAADPHPLVIAEACASGLPVIVSDRVGCVGPTDDAQPGRNTVVFPLGDLEALAAATERLAGDKSLRESYTAGSRAIYEGRRMSRSVEAIEEAVSRLSAAEFSRTFGGPAGK